MAAISTYMVPLIALTGLISVLLVYWLHVSGSFGLNMLREWLCLSFSEQSGEDVRASGPNTPASAGTSPKESGDSHPSKDHPSEDSGPDEVILSEGPHARPSASRAFYPALFTLLTICLVALTAGVAIPVRGFLTDRVQSGAINYELANVQKAIDLMMVEYSLGSLPDPGPGTSKGLRKDPVDATRDMSVFPYMEHGDYALFGGSTGDYLTHNTEALYYVDVAGMVYQVIPEAR